MGTMPRMDPSLLRVGVFEIDVEGGTLRKAGVQVKLRQQPFMPTFNPKRRVPHGITLIGRLFDEGVLGRVGIALERAFAVADERPPGF